MLGFMREVLSLIFKWMQIFPSLVGSYAEPVEDRTLYHTHH